MGSYSRPHLQPGADLFHKCIKGIPLIALLFSVWKKRNIFLLSRSSFVLLYTGVDELYSLWTGCLWHHVPQINMTCRVPQCCLKPPPHPPFRWNCNPTSTSYHILQGDLQWKVAICSGKAKREEKNSMKLHQGEERGGILSARLQYLHFEPSRWLYTLASDVWCVVTVFVLQISLWDGTTL